MKSAGGPRGVKRATAASAFERTGGAAGFGFEAYRAAEEFSSPVYSGEEELLRLPFRALLTKKDPTTRIKAIADLEEAFKTLAVETCREALPHWAFLFERCQKDNERRVRLATARIIALLLEKLPKAMAEKRWDSFAADCLCGCFDPEAECAATYKRSLESAKVSSIPDTVLTKLSKYVRQRAPDESFDDFGGTPEEINERSFRVRSQALHAIAYVVNREQSLDLSSLNEGSTWNKYLLAADHDGGQQCRIGAYQLLAALATQDHQDVISQSSVLKSVMRIPSEKDRVPTPSMWNALLAVCQKCPEFWKNIDALRKGFFPELFRHVERRCNDSGFASLSNLFVFLSLLPDAVWESYGYETFIREWFDKLLTVSNAENAPVEVSAPVILSGLECVNYLLKKKKITREVEEGRPYAFLKEKVEQMLRLCVERLASVLSLQEEMVAQLISALMAVEMTESEITTKFDSQDILRTIMFLTIVIKSRAFLNASGLSVQSIFTTAAIEAIEQAAASEKPKSSDQAICVLFDACPKAVLETKGKHMVSLLKSGEFSFERFPRLAARLVVLDPESFSMVCQLITDGDTTSSAAFTFFTSLNELGYVPAREEDLDSSSVLIRRRLIAENQIKEEEQTNLAGFMNSELRNEWLERLKSSARNLLERREMADVESIDAICRSLRSFNNIQPDDLKEMFLLESFGSNVELGEQSEIGSKLSEDDVNFIVTWLASSPDSWPVDIQVRWAKVLIRLNRPLPTKPHPGLIVALIKEGGVKKTADLLGHDDHDDEDLIEFVWEMMNVDTMMDDIPSEKLEVNLWIDDVVPFVLGLMSESNTQEVERLRKLFALIPPSSFHESDTFKYIDWVHAALERDNDLAQEHLLPLFLQRLRDDGIDLQIHQAFTEATLRACFVVAEAQEETARANNTSSTPAPPASPSPSPPPPSVSPASGVLKTGDAVLYERTAGEKQAATVVIRHDDGGAEPYYTIRWWAEDRSRETQTTRDRLTLRTEVTKEQAAEEETKKKLVEVQRQLQEARQSGNRQEIVRLMKLQQELLPKPKDTDEEKAKVEAARQKAEQEWREKRNARGLLAKMNDGENEGGGNDESVAGSEEWNFAMRFALRFLSRFAWRFQSDSPMPLNQAESDALAKVLSPTSLVWIPIPSSESPTGRKDLTTLAKVLLLHPEWILPSGEFVSKTVALAAQMGLLQVCADLSREFSALISESAAGRLLLLFARAEEAAATDSSAMNGVAMAIPRFRFPARLVWEVSEDIFTNRLMGKRIGSSLAGFACLYRYPGTLGRKSSQPAVNELPSDELQDAKEVDEQRLIEDARRFFPDYLLTALDRLLKEEESSSEEENLTRRVELLLVWMLVLRYIQLAWKSNPADARESIGRWLRRDYLIYRMLGIISSLLTLSEEMNPLLQQQQSSDDTVDDSSFVAHLLVATKSNPLHLLSSKLASRSFFQTVHVLPAMVREWWMDHLPNRFDKEGVSKFTSLFVTPNVLKTDMLELNDAVRNRAWDSSELSVKFSLSTRVVTICSFKDDCSLEMEISFPDTYPLFPAKVECTKQIGVKPEKWKRWALQIVMLLGKRDGTLSDAVHLWKQNLDKEFEGVEPCPICYSVLHAVDSSLPKVACKTCKNVFHGKCLSQWFASSHQSLCPLCKQSFMAPPKQTSTRDS